MPHHQELSERLRLAFEARGVAFETKAMFGGLCFMVDGKMCVGVTSDRLMVRFDPAAHDEVLARPGCKPMDFTKRVMKGFAFVESQGTRTAAQLDRWVALALEFNPRAKASKKRHRDIAS